MAVNTAQIKSLLEPGLYAVEGRYEMIETQWSKIFKRQKAKLATERKAQMRFLGLPYLKAEGAGTTFDNNSGHRFYFNSTTFEVGLGYAITRKAIDDNQYTSDFNQNNLGLIESFAQFKEIQAANILNNSTTYDTQIGGDGVALLSTAHPYDQGTWANKFTIEQDLNESTLLNAALSIRTNFVNEAGLKIYARAKKLVIPPTLLPIADRLVKAELRPGTSNNDPNVIRTIDGGVTDYVVLDFLTSNFAWFLTTNIDGLVMFERVKFETSMWTDDTTDNLLVKAYERYQAVYNDPRCLWGSLPTS